MLTKEVLCLLRIAGTTTNLKKGFFFSNAIEYLGHIIVPGKLQVAQKTTKAVESPQYSTSVPIFAVVTHPMKHLPQDCAKSCTAASPLNKKLKKGEPLRFELYDTKRKTADVSTEKLTTPPVLASPRLNSQYTINKDDREIRVGRVMLQE